MRKAFTLLELLIVVVIIGLVYTLAVNNLSKVAESSEPLSLANLKEFMQKIPHEKRVEFICLENCRKCFILRDSEHLSEYDELFDKLLDGDVQSYIYTSGNGFEKREEGIFFIDERNYESVCFSYEIDGNGQGEEIFVQHRGRVYDFASQFENKVYESLDALQTDFEKLRMQLQ